MNKLDKTSSARPRLLSDGELTQVVGGHRGWGGGNHGGGNHGGGNHSMKSHQGNGHDSQLARQVTFNITIIKNTSTIINNNTFL